MKSQQVIMVFLFVGIMISSMYSVWSYRVVQGYKSRLIQYQEMAEQQRRLAELARDEAMNQRRLADIARDEAVAAYKEAQRQLEKCK
jgi:hypothetical protein